MINLAYSPSLSSLEIMVDSECFLFCEILEEFSKFKHSCKEKEILLHKLLTYTQKSKNSCIEYENSIENSNIPEEIINFYYERYLTEGNNLKIIVEFDKIKFEFFEIRPPHSRQILISQLEDLVNSFEILKKIKISDITNDSLFSVLYSPFKSTKGLMMNSSFLVYYQFQTSNSNTKTLFNNISQIKNFVEVPVIGILPIKFENKIFMNPINKSMNSYMRNMNMMNNNSNYLIVKNLIVSDFFI
jgi:hypothetical protein